jgi:3-oxoacyl-[acyl-carrier-protein] synthase II
MLSLRDGKVPPTANHEKTGPEITIDVVAGSPRDVNGPVLSNSFGFGGHNATLIFAPVAEAAG